MDSWQPVCHPTIGARLGSCGGNRLTNRREFMCTLAIASLSGLVSAEAKNQSRASKKALRVLLLGGTGFIGLHYAHEALARGHRVSVFSRGKAEVEVPRQVEVLTGDRNGDLASIENRDWDALID